jgi:hypothetical protein
MLKNRSDHARGDYEGIARRLLGTPKLSRFVDRETFPGDGERTTTRPCTMVIAEKAQT